MTEPRDPAAVLVLQARFTRANAVSPYRLLPFDVAAGTQGIRVVFAHDGRTLPQSHPEHAALDLGLMAPQTGSEPDGFRGWSGSERTVVVLSEARCTPGYRAGSLHPGRWQVLLGCYRAGASGTRARVTVETLKADQVDAALTAADDLWRLDHAEARGVSGHGQSSGPAVAQDVPGWVRCDLHAHSLHSDGVASASELAALGAAVGLQALFLTDHNTDSHLPEVEAIGRSPLRERALVLPGEEVTTYGGHFNALGIRRWVDFRHCDRAGVEEAIDAVHSQGALASINHPRDNPCEWTFGAMAAIDAVEVWNGPWSRSNESSLAWWAALLESGARPTAVGGSDSHSNRPGEQPLGMPVTWVRADDAGLPAIVAGIRRRNVVVSRDASGPFASLELGMSRTGDVARLLPDQPASVRWAVQGGAGSEIVILSAHDVEHRTAVKSDGESGTWVSAPDAVSDLRWIRLEVRAANGALLSITNPIYLETD